MVLAGDKRRPVRYSLNEVSPYVCGKDYSVSIARIGTPPEDMLFSPRPGARCSTWFDEQPVGVPERRDRSVRHRRRNHDLRATTVVVTVVVNISNLRRPPKRQVCIGPEVKRPVNRAFHDGIRRRGVLGGRLHRASALRAVQANRISHLRGPAPWPPAIYRPSSQESASRGDDQCEQRQHVQCDLIGDPPVARGPHRCL
jgi:hypothetical protein